MDSKNSNGLRVIKTARTLEEINQCLRDGFKPIIREVEPASSIRKKYWVFDHNGKIEMITDSKIYAEKKKHGTLIFTDFYYPYKFPFHLSAYIIPKDIKQFERVFLEDLIEDVIGETDGENVYRQAAGEGFWTGEDIVLGTPWKKV